MKDHRNNTSHTYIWVWWELCLNHKCQWCCVLRVGVIGLFRLRKRGDRNRRGTLPSIAGSSTHTCSDPTGSTKHAQCCAWNGGGVTMWTRVSWSSSALPARCSSLWKGHMADGAGCHSRVLYVVCIYENLISVSYIMTSSRFYVFPIDYGTYFVIKNIDVTLTSMNEPQKWQGCKPEITRFYMVLSLMVGI